MLLLLNCTYWSEQRPEMKEHKHEVWPNCRKFGPLKGEWKYLNARSKQGLNFSFLKQWWRVHLGAPVWVYLGRGAIGREGNDPFFYSLITYILICPNEAGTTAGAMRGTKMSRMLRNAAGGHFRNEEFSPKENSWNDLRRSERIRRESRISYTKPDSQRKNK